MQLTIFASFKSITALFVSLFSLSSYSEGRYAPVPEHFKVIAHQYGIPSTLLWSMSLVESGRQVGSMFTSWPYTLRVGSDVYRFENAKVAGEVLKEAITLHPHIDIDIGRVQINYYWHKDYVDRVGYVAIFEDEYNVSRGAAILSDCMRSKLFIHCVGRYNALSPEKQQAYRNKVAKQIRKFVSSSINY